MRLFLIVGFTSIFSVMCQAEIIRFNIGVNGYPPYMIKHDNGEPNGIVVDILAHVASKLGYKMVYLEVPRKRVDHMLLNDELDATARAIEWTSKPERFEFSEPIVVMRDVLFSTFARPVQFHSAQDLFGKKLRTHIGYSYPLLKPYFESGEIYRYDDSHEEKMLENILLANGRFDAAVVDEVVGRWIIKNNQWGAHLMASENDIGAVDYRIMFNKKFADLMPQINAALQGLKNTGNLQHIIDRYTISSH